MTTLSLRDRAEFYADLYDVPIEEIERRYGLVLFPERTQPDEKAALT